MKIAVIGSGGWGTAIAILYLQEDIMYIYGRGYRKKRTD